MTDLRHNDIISYTPEHPFRRDGYAQVSTRYGTVDLTAKDTYSVSEAELTDEELATAVVLFNLDDVEERRHLNVEHYHPEDVFVLPTRKGIVVRVFLRKGAEVLPEKQIIARRAHLRYTEDMQARAVLLSPLVDQSLAAQPLPHMTIEETGAVRETLTWCQRASRQFERSLDHVVNIQKGGDGNLHYAIVHADDDHYELVRARRALDSKLAALREVAVAA